MVGVGHYLGDHIPCAFPGVGVHVHQNPHQFRHHQCRVGIVDMDGNLIGKVVQGTIGSQMVADDALQGRRHQEILLGQTEQLAFVVVVRGIQHLGDHFRIGGSFHGLHILPLREQRHIECSGIHRFPQAKHVDCLAAAAGDHHIVGNGTDGFVIVIGDAALAVLPVFVYRPAQPDIKGLVGSGYQPCVAAAHPVIRQFHLVSVDDFLLEQTIFIADGKTGCVIILCGQGVHKAGCQPSQPPVAKARIRFHFVNIVQIIAHGTEHIPVAVRQPQIHQIVPERTADEKFHAQVIHLLGPLLLCLFVEDLSLFRENVLHAHEGRFIHRLGIRFFRLYTEIPGQFLFQSFTDFRFGDGSNVFHISYFPSVCINSVRHRAQGYPDRKTEKAESSACQILPSP